MKLRFPNRDRPWICQPAVRKKVGRGCPHPVAIYVLLFLIARSLDFAAPLSDSALSSIRFDPKINSQISLDLPFVDENGTPVTLASCFHHKPVILVLGYYECPMLCTMVLNGMVESLQDLKPGIATDFDVINVSINPIETPQLAAAKKRTYLKRYGRSNASAGWHFLTGKEPAIVTLTTQVGFNYAYDPDSKQYAHPSGLIILTPDGKVSRYLFGVTFSATELDMALKDASARRAGSPIEQLVLLCFHYNPIRGKYGGLIMIIVRSLAAATLLSLLWFIISMLRREVRSPFQHGLPTLPLPKGEDCLTTKARAYAALPSSTTVPHPPP